MAKKKRVPEKYQIWIEARKRYHLSHAHVQMARELGMNPKKLGGKANHKQEPWKEPLPQFIEHLYFERTHNCRLVYIPPIVIPYRWIPVKIQNRLFG